MELIKFYGSIILAAVVGAVATLVIQPIVAEKILIKSDRWKIKREACLETLHLADAILSHYSWANIKDENIIKEGVKTVDIRLCYNNLACSCDNEDILIIFKKIIKGKNIAPDIIVDLRNAVRKELGFGADIDTDRESAYFVRGVWDNQ